MAQVLISEREGVFVAVVDGDLDSGGVAQVGPALFALVNERPGQVVVHLQVRFLASVGLSLLLELWGHAQNGDTELVFVLGSRAVRRQISSAGLAAVLPLADSVERALMASRGDDTAHT